MMRAIRVVNASKTVVRNANEKLVRGKGIDKKGLND